MSRNELDRVIDVLKTEQDNIQKTIVRLEVARATVKKQRRPRPRPVVAARNE